MTTLLRFPSRPARNAKSHGDSTPCEVVELPRREPIAYAARVLFEGRKRMIWACIVLHPDGEEEAYPCKTEKDARWLAGVKSESLAADRAMARDPLKRLLDELFALPESQRHAIARYMLGAKE